MKWVALGPKIVGYVFAAVNAIEKFLKAGKGKEKQDAAVEMVGDLLASIEGATEKDVLNDGKVKEAVQHLIDAVVSVQNAVAAAKAAKV